MALLSFARKNKKEDKPKKDEMKKDVVKKTQDEKPEAKTYSLKLSPVVTEKAYAHRAQDVAVFEVPVRTSKGQIREAFKAEYGFTPAKIRTSIMKSKPKRRGRHIGFTSPVKKAFVDIPKGKKITYAD